MIQANTDRSAGSPSDVDVTIVVCTFNRSGMLRDAVRSLTMLETAGAFRYEVLVVDNASTDDTQQVVAAIAEASPVPVRLAYQPRKGISPARNCGIEAACGEWIAFFDDDQLADSRWLLELRAAAAEQKVRSVGGAVRLLVPPGKESPRHPFTQMLLGASVGMDAPRAYTWKITPGAGNWMIHRSVFAEVGVFDESLGRAEDTNLFCRMQAAGIHSWYTPRAIIDHVTPADRLDAAWLRNRASHLGHQVADRERDDWGAVRFPLVWAAKALRTFVVIPLKLGWARLRGDHDSVVGEQCRFALSLSYLKSGFRHVVSPAGKPNKFTRPGVDSAPVASQGKTSTGKNLTEQSNLMEVAAR